MGCVNRFAILFIVIYFYSRLTKAKSIEWEFWGTTQIEVTFIMPSIRHSIYFLFLLFHSFHCWHLGNGEVYRKRLNGRNGKFIETKSALLSIRINLYSYGKMKRRVLYSLVIFSLHFIFRSIQRKCRREKEILFLSIQWETKAI